MTIKLVVEPKKEYTWDEFKAEKDPFSIGLDGIIKAPTMRDVLGPYANFDHHAGVDRSSTRATCAQVHYELNMGLMETFSESGSPKATVYINDPDEDTCLSWWLLKNYERVVNHGEPLVNRLVFCEDLLDTSAGAYNFGNIRMIREMGWIFQAYRDARYSGLIGKMDASQMQTIVEAVTGRISDYVNGNGEEIGLEGQYERIGGGLNWSMVKENGPLARQAMYADGINCFVSVLEENEDGSRKLVFGKRSPWVEGPNLRRVYDSVNELDRQLNPNRPENELSGGTGIIGGTPREGGTYLTLDQITDIMNSDKVN